MTGSESHRVLVVDDDRDSAELTALVLGGAGLQVAKVHSGQEALEAIHSLSPDLVLLDINMDEMDVGTRPFCAPRALAICPWPCSRCDSTCARSCRGSNSARPTTSPNRSSMMI